MNSEKNNKISKKAEKEAFLSVLNRKKIKNPSVHNDSDTSPTAGIRQRQNVVSKRVHRRKSGNA